MSQENVKGRLSDLLEKRRYTKACEEVIDLQYQKVVNLLVSDTHNAQAIATSFINDFFDGLPAAALQAESEGMLPEFLNTVVDGVSSDLAYLWPADEYSRSSDGWASIAQGFSFVQYHQINTVLAGLSKLSGPAKDLQSNFEEYRKFALKIIQENGERLFSEIVNEKDIKTLMYIYGDIPNKSIREKFNEHISRAPTSRFPVLQSAQSGDLIDINVSISAIQKSMLELEKRLDAPPKSTL